MPDHMFDDDGEEGDEHGCDDELAHHVLHPRACARQSGFRDWLVYQFARCCARLKGRALILLVYCLTRLHSLTVR